MITITIPKWVAYFFMFWLVFQIFASPLTQAFIKGLTGHDVPEWISRAFIKGDPNA